jgi:hypothetical protein
MLRNGTDAGVRDPQAGGIYQQTARIEKPWYNSLNNCAVPQRPSVGRRD